MQQAGRVAGVGPDSGDCGSAGQELGIPTDSAREMVAKAGCLDLRLQDGWVRGGAGWSLLVFPLLTRIPTKSEFKLYLFVCFYGKLQVRISHEQLRHFSLTPPLLATFNLKHNTYIFMYKARRLDIGAKVVTKAEHASSRPGICVSHRLYIIQFVLL